MTSVVASRYAVVIHAMWETPPSSPTMVGIAVDTMVWSRAAMSMPASRAPKIVLIRRRVRTSGTAPGAAADSVVGASNCTPREEGRRRVAAPIERPGGTRWFRGLRTALSAGVSARRCRQPGGQDVPRLVDEVGEGRGEVAGEPAVQGGPHGDTG